MKTKAERITNLRGKIGKAAGKIARKFHANADDVESDITIAILERFVSEPGFLEQNDSYVLQHGAWAARDMLKKHTALWLNKTAELELSNDKLTTDPWQIVMFNQAVADALATLNATDQVIATGLAQGYTPREVAGMAGVSYKTVYNRRNGPIHDAFSAI